jgi:hypothetical protein
MYGGLYEGVRVPTVEFAHHLSGSHQDEEMTPTELHAALEGQPNFWYWELLVAVPRKLLLAVIVTVVRTPLLQATLLLMVLTLALVLQVAARPYLTLSLNSVETLSLVTLWASAFAGLVLADVTARDLSDTVENVVQTCVAVTNGAFVFGTLLVLAAAVAAGLALSRHETRLWVVQMQRAVNLQQAMPGAEHAGDGGDDVEEEAGHCLAWPCTLGSKRGLLAWGAYLGCVPVHLARRLGGG